MVAGGLDGPWGALESELQRVAAVEKVRVLGETAPSAIHIVASPVRRATQVAEDVCSVVIATTPHSVDPGIVSVVQLDDAPGAFPRANPRPVLDSVVVASKQGSGWVKLRLLLPNGEIREGTASASPTRQDRARAAVDALLQALEGTLDEMEARVEIDKTILSPPGAEDLVLLRGTFFDKNRPRRISGSASVVDDTATAAARALLDAMNRHLRFADA